MPKYDCRKDGRDPAAVSFPCNVRVLDPATGERIAGVFFLDTSPARVGRFPADLDGRPLVNPRTRRKRWVAGKAVVEYDRLELWESRPWVAVRLDGGGVVAKSEGCP